MCLNKDDKRKQALLIFLYVLIFSVMAGEFFLYRPDTDYVYKGISRNLIVHSFFLPCPIFLFVISLLLQQRTLKLCLALLSLPLALLFSCAAMITTIDLMDIRLKGYDPSLELLHKFDFGEYDVCVYRDIPHMAFDPYSVIIRQEKDLRCEVKQVRTLHFQYRSPDIVAYEISADQKLKIVFEPNTDPVIFTLRPLATGPFGLWVNWICRMRSPHSQAHRR